EVECVDLHGNTRDAGIDVGTNERAVTGETFGVAIENYVVVWQSASTFGRVHKKSEDTAVGDDVVIALGGKCKEGYDEELVFESGMKFSRSLNFRGTVVDGQFTQGLLSHVASVVNHASNIQALGGYLSDNFTGVGVENISGLLRGLGGLPLTLSIGRQDGFFWCIRCH